MMEKIQVLVLAGLLVLYAGGCGKKEKAALREKEETIRVLEERIEGFRAEIAALQQSLAEKEGLTLELAGLLRQARSEAIPPTGVGSGEPEEPGVSLAPPTSPPPTDVQGSFVPEAAARAASQDGGAVSPEVEIAFLQKENQRLQAELDHLRVLLMQTQAATAAVSAEPTDAPVFGTLQIGIAYESFAQSTSSAQRLEVLDSLLEYSLENNPEILPILERALDDPDPEVAQRAADLLEPMRGAEALPLIEKALHSRDEQTRLSALSPLEQIEDPRAAELAALALSDPSPAVRSQALEVIRGQTEEIQILSLSRAMESVADEVKSDVLSLLELRGDKQAVEVILTGMKDPNPEFREEVKGVLEFLLDQEFGNYNQAVRWWKANQDKYDENLFEK